MRTHTLLLLMLLLIASCQTDNGRTSTLSSLHTKTYLGNGSVWQWDLTEAGNFTATQKSTLSSTTPILQVAGTYTAPGTGFYQFTISEVTACNGCQVTPTVGQTSLGMATPEVVLGFQEFGTTLRKLTPAVAKSNCFDAEIDLVHMEANPADNAATNISANGYWGSLRFANAGNINSNQFQFDGTQKTSNNAILTTQSCNGSEFTLANTNNVLVANEFGFYIGQSSGNQFFGFPYSDGLQRTSLNKKVFVGLLYRESTRQTTAVSFDFAGNNLSDLFSFSNVTSTNTSTLGTIEMSEEGTGPSSGFVKILLDFSSGPDSTLWGSATFNINATGRSFLYATGLENGSNTNTVTLFAIQR